MSGRITGGLGRIKMSHILVLAFVLRILFYVIVYENFADAYGWRSDDNYDEIAKNVLAGKGYRINDTEPPTTVRAPIYTLFLMLVYGVFGDERWKVVVAQALLQILACWILYRMARKMTNSENVAKVTAVLFAIYPQSMLYGSMLLTESLFTLLTILTAYLYFGFIQKEDVKHTVLLGVLFGVTALTRPVSLLLALPLLAWYMVGKTRTAWKRGLRNSFAVISVMVLTLMPWTVRNYLVSGSLVPVASRGGHFLYSNTITDREEEVDDQIREFGKADNNDPEKRDTAYLHLALENIAERPHLFLKNTLATVLDFWYRGHSRSTSLFNGLVNFSLLFMGVLGVIYYKRCHGAMLVPFIVFVLYYNICYGLLHAISRYSFPVMAFVMFYASYYLCRDVLRESDAKF
jgi:4-amino-4-deoxy-L-arabinose transferase-like glycosyltransferase